MTQIETQILMDLASLLCAALIAAIGFLARKTKEFLDAQLAAQQAVVANHVIDALSGIADSVVRDFNQRVVLDAKANGVFNAQLATAVKADAIAAVKAQGAPLLALGAEVLGDVDSLVSGLIEKAVADNKEGQPVFLVKK